MNARSLEQTPTPQNEVLFEPGNHQAHSVDPPLTQDIDDPDYYAWNTEPGDRIASLRPRVGVLGLELPGVGPITLDTLQHILPARPSRLTGGDKLYLVAGDATFSTLMNIVYDELMPNGQVLTMPAGADAALHQAQYADQQYATGISGENTVDTLSLVAGAVAVPLTVGALLAHAGRRMDEPMGRRSLVRRLAKGGGAIAAAAAVPAAAGVIYSRTSGPENAPTEGIMRAEMAIGALDFHIASGDMERWALGRTALDVQKTGEAAGYLDGAAPDMHDRRAVVLMGGGHELGANELTASESARLRAIEDYAELILTTYERGIYVKLGLSADARNRITNRVLDALATYQIITAYDDGTPGKDGGMIQFGNAEPINQPRMSQAILGALERFRPHP